MPPTRTRPPPGASVPSVSRVTTARLSPVWMSSSGVLNLPPRSVKIGGTRPNVRLLAVPAIIRI